VTRKRGRVLRGASSSIKKNQIKRQMTGNAAAVVWHSFRTVLAQASSTCAAKGQVEPHGANARVVRGCDGLDPVVKQPRLAAKHNNVPVMKRDVPRLAATHRAI